MQADATALALVDPAQYGPVAQTQPRLYGPLTGPQDLPPLDGPRPTQASRILLCQFGHEDPPFVWMPDLPRQRLMNMAPVLSRTFDVES